MLRAPVLMQTRRKAAYSSGSRRNVTSLLLLLNTANSALHLWIHIRVPFKTGGDRRRRGPPLLQLAVLRDGASATEAPDGCCFAAGARFASTGSMAARSSSTETE